jgi:hypothetical protein
MNALLEVAVLATALTAGSGATAAHAGIFDIDQSHQLDQQDGRRDEGTKGTGAIGNGAGGNGTTGAIGINMTAPGNLGFSVTSQDTALTLPADEAGLIFGMTNVPAFVNMRSALQQATWVRMCRRTGYLQAFDPALPTLEPGR